eukprot:TRINITY_DN6429_c0_g1_i1.p1 TRINITY_DN6429_c0_g1~~TRINITY_DN6429_c0_g1_i1.p1  ORF type:complete len:441 (-),score=30.39 TRINITY_DN6429_c0_g1_i1:9-1331(-)
MFSFKHLSSNICIILLSLAAFTAAVTLQRLSPSHVILTARLYELRVNETVISMHMRRRATGMIRENDYVQYNFQAWRDDMWWSHSPNNGTTECSRTTTTPQNFTGPFRVEVGDGPGGTTLVSSFVSFGEGCNLTVSFYVTDQDTWIVVDGYNNTILANEAKLSFRMNCPWRSQLVRYADVPLSDEVWGRGRRFTVYSYFNVITSAQFNDYPRGNFSKSPIGWQDYPASAESACKFTPLDPATHEYPTPSIYPDFDFAREATLTFSTTESLTVIGFLTWAISDGYRRVRVGSDVGDREMNLNGLGYIYWPVDLHMEGYNTVYYDPSLTQIFFEDADYIDKGNNAPGQQGGPTDFSQDAGVSGGAIAGIVVAVAVVAIISAAAWFLVRRKEHQRARSRLESSLGRAGSTETGDQGIKSNAKSASEGWAKGSKERPITNVKTK